jgi:hypothetical protein
VVPPIGLITMHLPGGRQTPLTQHSIAHVVPQPHLVAGTQLPSEQQPSLQNIGSYTQAPVEVLHESVVQGLESSQIFTPRVQRCVVRLQLSEVQAELSAQSVLVVQHSAMGVNVQRPAVHVSVVQATPSLQSPELAQQLAIFVFVHRPPASHVSVVQARWSSQSVFATQQAERASYLQVWSAAQLAVLHVTEAQSVAPAQQPSMRKRSQRCRLALQMSRVHC